MSRLDTHLLRVFAWLIAIAGAAPAGEMADASAGATSEPKLTAGASLLSDYVYRGISYSAHQPSTGAFIEAQQGWLYSWLNFNSVKFSTLPAVELTAAAGLRATLAAFYFDIGAAYYYYPGEIGPELSNYWEGHATVSHKLTDTITLGSTVAYAPDVWQTGAWGTYAAGTLSFDLPTGFLPADVGWSLSFDLGRSQFGRTSSGGGVSAGATGLPLPAYTNWRAGLTFNYRAFKLGFNYTGTNLSQESCYVMTGDLGAIPGGAITPGNPIGLRSGLCGATFSGTLGFEINPTTLRR